MKFNYLSSEELFNRQFGKEFYANRFRPIIIGINLRSPENIGGLIRIAGNIGCEKIIFAGENSNFKSGKIKRVALNAYDIIPHFFTRLDEWKNLIPDDYKIIAIETAKESTNLYKTILPGKVAFMVGDEREGIPTICLEQCDSAVYIPMPGHTLSLNVIQSAAISLFEWYRNQ